MNDCIYIFIAKSAQMNNSCPIFSYHWSSLILSDEHSFAKKANIYMLLILINRLNKLHDISLEFNFFRQFCFDNRRKSLWSLCVSQMIVYYYISVLSSAVRASLNTCFVVQESSGARGNGQGYDLAGEGGWGMISQTKPKLNANNTNVRCVTRFVCFSAEANAGDDR